MVLENIRLEGFYFYGVGKTSLVGEKIDELGTTKVTLKTVVSPVLPNVKFKDRYHRRTTYQEKRCYKAIYIMIM